MAANPTLCETSADAPGLFRCIDMWWPQRLSSQYLCVYLGVSINFIGRRNKSKIERGVIMGPPASTAPLMNSKFSKAYGPCQAIH